MTDELQIAQDIQAVHEGVTGVTTAMMAFMIWTGRRFIKKVDDTADELSRHKLEDVSKYATNDQLTRIHDRIDRSIASSEENFKELRNDIGEIKNLLIAGARK